MAGSMMLERTVLPDVLPTERLLPNGLARPEVRADLRRIADGRNALAVVGLWVMAVGDVAAAVWIGHPLAYAAAFVLMVPLYVRFAILMHEAAHKLLFSNKRANDLVGMWLIAYPAWTPITLYRRGHFAHHKDEFGPNEPDIPFYGGYPCRWADLRRRLIRDAVGISGWKNLKVLLKATRTKTGREVAVPILSVQAGLWAVSWLATGRWFVYPLLWLGPWMTGWRVVNRLRAIAEHGGLGRSDDRRQTTHDVRQSLLARFWIVPYNTGWHLAHHVDMGIPWRNLPAFHAELAAAGYTNDTVRYPSYIALWKALCSGPVTPAPPSR
jgi:fatty acid desaturase